MLLLHCILLYRGLLSFVYAAVASQMDLNKLFNFNVFFSKLQLNLLSNYAVGASFWCSAAAQFYLTVM